MLATTVNVPSWLLPGLILGILGAILTWVTRAAFHAFRDSVEGWFQSILKEVKPNGGNTDSLGDQVVQVKASVGAVAQEQGAVKAELLAVNGKVTDALARVEQGVAGIYPRIEQIEVEQGRVKDELASLKKDGADS